MPAMNQLRSGTARLRVLLAITVIALATDSRAAIEFTRLAIPDDVPAHLCSALAQDSDGFIWIGTQNGLVRYDGHRFRTHRFDPNDDSTIGGSYIRALLASRDGRLWAGTFSGGLSVYDP